MATTANIPKDNVVESKGDGVDSKPAPKPRAKTAKRKTTKEEPVRKPKMTDTFNNKSRNPIHIGPIVIQAGQKRDFPKSVSSALQQQSRTQYYMNRGDLVIS